MTETAEPERIATYALRASPPLMRRGFGVAFGFLAVFLGIGLGIEFRHFAPLAVTMTVGAVLGAALVILFWRRITHVRSSPPIVVTNTHVVFPGRKVRLEDITSFEEFTRGAQRVFIVGTTAGFLTYPARSFVDPEGFGGLRDLVRSLVVNVLHRARLPATIELSRKRWTWLLLINVAISLLPFVDALAHIGGFGGGALAAWALARAIAPNPRVKKATLAAALGLGALYAAGFVGSFVYRSAATTTPAEDYAMTRFVAKRPAIVNQAAWDVARDPASAPELLARAEKAARRAIALEPDNDSFVDTRAYLLQRLGRADEALAIERGAVWRTPRPTLAAMLLRMLQSREQEGLLVRRDSAEFIVEGAALPEGGVVYARVDRDGRPVGLLRIVLPEGNAGRAPAPASGTLTLTGDVTLHGLWSDGATDRPERADAPIAAVLEVDAATLQLPWP